MTIVDGAHADQRVTVDLVEFEAHAQIILRGDGAAAHRSQGADRCPNSCVDRYPGCQIDAHLVRGDAGVDEYFSAMFVCSFLVGVILLCSRSFIARALIAAVAHEAGQAAKTTCRRRRGRRTPRRRRSDPSKAANSAP